MCQVVRLNWSTCCVSMRHSFAAPVLILRWWVHWNLLQPLGNGSTPSLFEWTLGWSDLDRSLSESPRSFFDFPNPMNWCTVTKVHEISALIINFLTVVIKWGPSWSYANRPWGWWTAQMGDIPGSTRHIAWVTTVTADVIHQSSRSSLSQTRHHQLFPSWGGMNQLWIRYEYHFVFL